MIARICRTIFVGSVVLFAVTAMAQQGGQAPGVDLTGTWDLQTSVPLLQEGEEETCDFAGTSTISQDGNDISGTSDLSLTSGPAACPSEMTASLTGFVNGSEIEMGALMGGQLGEADFNGSAGVEGLGASGVFDVISGPFGGASGSWSAVLAGGPPVIAVPTLTGVGLTLLVLLVLAAGAFFLRRQQLSVA